MGFTIAGFICLTVAALVIIFRVKEVNLPPHSSRFIVAICANLGWYLVNPINIPFLGIHSPRFPFIKWLIPALLGIGALICAVMIYQNREKEWEALKKNQEIFFVVVLCAVSRWLFSL